MNSNLKPVRIAYLTVQMPAPSEVFLAVEINGLRAAGVEVQVFALRNPHPDHAKLIADQQLEEVAIGYFPFFGASTVRDVLYWLLRQPGGVARSIATVLQRCWCHPGVLLRSLAIVPKSFSVARVIEQEGITILHTAWSHYPAVTAFVVKELMPQVRLTMALGAYDRLTHHPMTEVAANRAEFVFTQSAALRGLIAREFPRITTPIVSIARGVDLSALAAHRSAERTPGLVVSTGRLIEPKGHQHVIRAVALMRGEFPQVRLKLFGQGEYRDTLEQLVDELGVRDIVDFQDHVAQSEMFAQIAKAQVFVLASTLASENLPNSVKEAMALGIPVVTTPTTGIEELVQDGRTGYIVSAEDVDGLAFRMRLLLNDSDLARRVGDAAIKHVERVAGLEHSSSMRLHHYTRMQSGQLYCTTDQIN